jgi:hypothetical protein
MVERRPGFGARQQGVAMIEFALVALLGLLPLVLGILQVTALLVAHDVLALATFQATRTGTLRGADPQAMRATLARGLLPLYVPVARDGRVNAARALAGYGQALAEVIALDELTVIEPTRSSTHGLLESRGARQVLPNSAIEWRSAASQAASVLTVSVMHCQPLVVPLVGPALAGLLELTSGAGTSAEARCRAAGRVPLRTRASLVMQTDLPWENLSP